MALRIDDLDDYLERASTLSTSWTIACWVNFPASPAAYASLWCVRGSGVTYPWFSCIPNATGADIAQYNGVGVASASSPFSTDTWYYTAFSRSGTSWLRTWSNRSGSFIQELEQTSVGAITQTTITIGRVASAGDRIGDCRYAHLKIWDAALTIEELEREMAQAKPVRFDNLWSWTPFLSDAIDYSGNGNDFAEYGAITYEDGPPVAWGNPIWVVPFAEKGDQVVELSMGRTAGIAQGATAAGIASLSLGRTEGDSSAAVRPWVSDLVLATVLGLVSVTSLTRYVALSLSRSQGLDYVVYFYNGTPSGRSYGVDAESRVWEILQESRVVVVDSSNRVSTVEG